MRTGTGISIGAGSDSYARTRNGQPVVGTATTRRFGTGGGTDFVSFPFYGPWGSGYPWYGGFGWNMGFVGYNPWYFGATRWFYGPHGLWYDPYSYYWDPYSDMGGRYDSRRYEEDEPETMGSLRIKAKPGSAKVYVDGALVGVVDDFSGLNDHLKIEGGRHTLEIRADGYQTLSQEIDVKVGKTQTFRPSLKKK